MNALWSYKPVVYAQTRMNYSNKNDSNKKPRNIKHRDTLNVNCAKINMRQRTI